MSHQIDPLILQKLRAFAQRRRRLIIFRGLCAAVATLLLTMMLIALLDRLVRLPDEARWALSMTAYAAVIFVEWRACVRLLLHSPDPRRLARLVENAEPKLREDLLSAVELGDARSNAAFDSEQFRALLQSDVARRMEGMQMEKLLPVNLVRRYTGIAAAIALACVVAFYLSGGQFGTLLLRALAPGANLDRVSRVKVKIVEPHSPEQIVAQGETIPLIIETSGQRTNSAQVELITQGRGERVKMTPIGPDRFSTTIQVGREDILYRVYAGDAVTRKYRLQTIARPHVIAFEKRYIPPAYTRAAAREVKEENGDLIGLEGSEVELRLKTNQPVRSAELRLQLGNETQTVPLALDGEMLVGRVPLQKSGTYRVALVAAATGFENKFSPEYALRAEADLLPQIELTLPKQDLILPANEIVDIEGSASDDQALAEVSQLVKINEGQWQTKSLAQLPGEKTGVSRRWDLFEQGVRAGDLVTTKLVAIDLKGNRSESRTLQVTITQAGFETSRLQTLDAQRQLYALLAQLRTSAEAFEKRSKETREQFERLPENDPQRSQVIVEAKSVAEDFAFKTTEVWNALIAALKNGHTGSSTVGLVQLGRLLSQMDTGAAEWGRNALTAAAAAPSGSLARDQVREFAETSSRVTHRARMAEQAHRVFLSAEEVDALCENFQIVAGEQERLLELGKNSQEDAARWAQFGKRLRVVLSELRSLEEMLAASAPRASGDRLKRFRDRLVKEHDALERAIGDAAPNKNTLPPLTKLAQLTAETARGLLDQSREQQGAAVRAHQDLLRENQPTYATLERLRQDLQQLVGRKLEPEAERPPMLQRLKLRSEIVKRHGDVEESRANPDSPFVHDVRKTTLALDAVSAAAKTAKEPLSALAPIEKEFRLLETTHNVAEALEVLNVLATAERWEIVSSRSRTTNPRDWEWIEARLRALPDELGKTQQDAPVRAVVEQAQKVLRESQKQPAWNELNQEMKDRTDPKRTPTARVVQVEQLAATVKQALDLLREPIREARERLAALAPKLSETLAQLAKETAELKTKTEKAAQETPEQAAQNPGEAAQQVLAEQQQLNAKVDSVKDALRADANQQNVMQQEGRERARDADDALALLKEPPPKAEEALTKAAQSLDQTERKAALETAAQPQQKLADALSQLAAHYENVEQGKADESRLALRATEQETGIKAAMDRQAARAEDLSKMAGKSPDELLKQLEAALEGNPTMQKELSSISQNTLDAAATQLAQASQQESQTAEAVEKAVTEQKARAAAMASAPPTESLDDLKKKLETQNAEVTQLREARAAQPQGSPEFAQANDKVQAKKAEIAQTQAAVAQAAKPIPQPPPPTAPAALAAAAQQQQPIGQGAKAAGESIERAGRHEQRLDNKIAGERIEALGSEVKETAMNEVAAAGQSLAKAAEAGPAEQMDAAQQAVATANSELKQELGQLQAAASAPPARQNGALPSPATNAATPSAEPAPASSSPMTTAPGVPASPVSPAPLAANALPEVRSIGDLASALPPGMETPATTAGTPSVAATPQEQVWMARTLDALDAALNSDPAAPGKNEAGSENAQSGQDGKPGQPGQQSQAGQQPGGQPQPASATAMEKAQQALASAAQAAAAAMRSARAPAPPAPPGVPGQGQEQLASESGVAAETAGEGMGQLPGSKSKGGEWGKLPKKMAEQLTRGQSEAVAGEYRTQVEAYYRVIAEKSKKP